MKFISKYINKYTILLSLVLSSIIIAILYSINCLNLFVGNLLIVFATFIIQLISVEIFLIMADVLIVYKKSFKLRLIQTIKAILVAQMITLPVGCIVLLMHTFFNFSPELISKTIVITTNYVVLAFLYLSYPFSAKKDSYTTIKVVSLTIVLIMILRCISHSLI